jgi:hypothetical protein
MSIETTTFKIGLSGTYWDKKPNFTISVNNQVYESRSISAESGVTEYFTFTTELTEGPAVLSISLLNKEDSDVKKDNYDDPVNFKILGDMLLNIESIEIDEIDIGTLRHTASEFFLAVPQSDSWGNTLITSIKECVNLGWNGTYRLPFESPFYVWLLENM